MHDDRQPGAAWGSQPTLHDVHDAERRIAGLVRHTPLFPVPELASDTGAALHLKLENLQETGSFKVRGAANRILAMAAEERARGVITVSTGNHGRAVAWVAARLSIPAVVCMSERVPDGKRRAIAGLGAEVAVRGGCYDEAEAHSRRLEEERGLVRIEPFDDPLVIAGQGTVGLELLRDLPEIRSAVVPLSGGGLISGVALALKAADPAIRVIGVSQQRAPVMVASLRAGRPVELPEESTLADALAGGIGLANRHTFAMVRDLIDETVLVSEEEIAGAMLFALQSQRVVVEGGGAVALAAVLHRRITSLPGPAAVVVSGGNVDLTVLRKLHAASEHTPEAVDVSPPALGEM